MNSRRKSLSQKKKKLIVLFHACSPGCSLLRSLFFFVRALHSWEKAHYKWLFIIIIIMMRRVYVYPTEFSNPWSSKHIFQMSSIYKGVVGYDMVDWCHTMGTTGLHLDWTQLISISPALALNSYRQPWMTERAHLHHTIVRLWQTLHGVNRVVNHFPVSKIEILIIYWIRSESHKLQHSNYMQ